MRKYKRKNVGNALYSIIILSFLAWLDENIRSFCIILLLIVIGLLIIKYVIQQIKKERQRQKYLSSSLYQIDKMSGEEFENYLKAHFENLGYTVELTPTTADYGADLILHKERDVIAVQAKRWNGKVSNKAVQEIVASLSYYNADRGMVITNSYFTDNAKILAEKNGVELWDRNNLVAKLKVKNL